MLIWTMSAIGFTVALLRRPMLAPPVVDDEVG